MALHMFSYSAHVYVFLESVHVLVYYWETMQCFVFWNLWMTAFSYVAWFVFVWCGNFAHVSLDWTHDTVWLNTRFSWFNTCFCWLNTCFSWLNTCFSWLNTCFCNIECMFLYDWLRDLARIFGRLVLCLRTIERFLNNCRQVYAKVSLGTRADGFQTDDVIVGEKEGQNTLDPDFGESMYTVQVAGKVLLVGLFLDLSIEGHRMKEYICWEMLWM